MLENQKTEIFIERIRKAHQISLITHVNPDGDAIGSTTGLHHFLRKMDIPSKVILPSAVAQNLDYLKENAEVLTYTLSDTEAQDSEKYIRTSDLIICCDFNSISRSGKVESILRDAQSYKILIDHHPGPAEEEFNLIFSDPDSSSTCELLYSLLKVSSKYLQREDLITNSCARSIATGLITDTNNFSNSSSAATFRTAAELLEMGISLETIKRQTFGGYSENRMRLLGELLSSHMHILPEIGVAYTILSKETQSRFNYQTGDTEGVVNMPLNIKGIRLSAFFTESDENIRASFRSVEPVSSNDFSRKYFHGGGHERAAGGKFTAGLNELEEYFKKSITEYINSIDLE